MVLRRGANVNDRDGLTDLSLLHFACKSGAAGVGNIDAAVNLVNSLLNKGADCDLRCKWTNMNALHYAVYFDIPEIVDTLLEHKPALLQSVCEEFEGGTALHIAASNLSLRATQILLQHGADPKQADKHGHTPLDIVPSNQTNSSEDEVTNQMRALLHSATEMRERQALTAEQEEREGEREGEREEEGGGEKEKEEEKENAMEVELTLVQEEEKSASTKTQPAPQGKPPRSPAPAKPSHAHTLTSSLAVRKTVSPRTRDPVRTRGNRSPVSTVSTVSSASSRAVSPAVEEVTMETLGLKIGDRILIDAAKSLTNKAKPGTIRFGGTIDTLGGQWAGVELDEPIGKNDGSLKGIRFFTCKPKYGLFVPMHRISKAPQKHLRELRRKKSANGGRKRESVALSPRSFEARGAMSVTTDLQVGERVSIEGNGTGVLRFVGSVKFAPGIWMGVELDSGGGDNSGSHSGVRYFSCAPNHGVFLPPSKVKRLSPALTASTNSGGGSASTGSNDSPDYPVHTSSHSPSPHQSPPVTKRRLATASTAKAAPRPKQPRTSVTTTQQPSSLSHTHPSLSTSQLSLSSLPNVTLETGMNVFVTGADFGVVRFIGTTEFAKGVWLGLELRRPNGKNDGSVKGHRYFKCKPQYGLFVKPEKATHRGINCSKILPESFLEKST